MEDPAAPVQVSDTTPATSASSSPMVPTPPEGLIVPSEIVSALCSHSDDEEIKNIYSRLQIDLCDDLRDLWDPTFARLRGPNADVEAAYSLCIWLSATAAAYNRDAETSPSSDWRITARARAELLRHSAEELAAIIEAATGIRAPAEVYSPPPPPPLIFFGSEAEE